MTLVEEVKLELGESTTILGTAFWSTAEVYGAINAALIAAYIDVNEDTVIGTATITSSTEVVDLPVTSVMVPKRIVGMQGEVFPTSYTELEIWKSNYNILNTTTDSGVPKWVTPYGSEQLRVWPLPDNYYVYDVYGVAWPGEVSATVTDLTLDKDLRAAVVALAVAFLVDDYYTELCEIKYMEYTQAVSSYRRTIRNRRGRAPVQLKPSGTFDRARSGSVALGRQFRGI